MAAPRCLCSNSGTVIVIVIGEPMQFGYEQLDAYRPVIEYVAWSYAGESRATGGHELREEPAVYGDYDNDNEDDRDIPIKERTVICRISATIRFRSATRRWSS